QGGAMVARGRRSRPANGAPRSAGAADARLQPVDLALAALDAIADLESVGEQVLHLADGARDVDQRRGGPHLALDDAPRQLLAGPVEPYVGLVEPGVCLVAPRIGGIESSAGL